MMSHNIWQSSSINCTIHFMDFRHVVSFCLKVFNALISLSCIQTRQNVFMFQKMYNYYLFGLALYLIKLSVRPCSLNRRKGIFYTLIKIWQHKSCHGLLLVDTVLGPLFKIVTIVLNSNWWTWRKSIFRFIGLCHFSHQDNSRSSS